MKKRIAAVAVLLVMAVSLSSCKKKEEMVSTEVEEDKEAAKEKQSGEGEAQEEAKLVGVSFPSQLTEQWVNDAAALKFQLEEAGYRVEAVFADNSGEKQAKQLAKLVQEEAACIITAPADSKALSKVMEQVKEKEIPVISYDQLLMDTDAVSYYVTFDNLDIGRKIGTYIEESKQLKEAQKEKKSYNIEFFMGDLKDNNALFVYKGIMEILSPYLEDGTLVCRSGKTSFEDTAVLGAAREQTKSACQSILDAFYSQDRLDIVCASYDSLAYGAIDALTESGYQVPADDEKEGPEEEPQPLPEGGAGSAQNGIPEGNRPAGEGMPAEGHGPVDGPDTGGPAGQPEDTSAQWPLVTGANAELLAVQNIIDKTQSMTILKASDELVEQCVKMVEACLDEETDVDINADSQYDNGVKVVPAYVCEVDTVDSDNYKKLLIDGGYITEEQLQQ